MELNINNKKYNIKIEKSIKINNLSFKMDSNYNILVKCSIFCSNNYIYKILQQNTNKIEKMYRLKHIENTPMYLGEVINISNPDKFYRLEIEKLYKTIIDDILKTLSFKCENFTVTFRKMKTKWGVCRINKREICLNTLLVKYPIICLEYTIIHELCHFQYPNHSKEFWELVKLNCPNYQLASNILKGKYDYIKGK